MKITTLKSGMYIAVLAGAMAFASCGKNNNQSEGAADPETENTETMDGSESPMDTVVNKNNDTIIDTGDARKPSNNPTGTQVP